MQNSLGEPNFGSSRDALNFENLKKDHKRSDLRILRKLLVEVDAQTAPASDEPRTADDPVGSAALEGEAGATPSRQSWCHPFKAMLAPSLIGKVGAAP